MKRLGLSALLLALCTCVKVNEPSAGSQTHFLASCEGSCPDPFVCSCGVCTRACTDDRTCRAEAPAATCSAGPSAEAACRVAPAVCDVECSASHECASLGAGFSCSEGRCRESNAGRTDASVTADSSAGDASGADVGSTTDAADSVADPLCDGSDAMRLGLNVEGGFVQAAYYFTNPYGHSFLFVDGRCRYYASTDYMHGVRTGTLSPGEAADLATAIGWSKLIEWARQPDQGTCPDGAATTFRRPGATTSCSCGCNLGATPPEKTAAAQQLYAWTNMLAEQGEPLTGSAAAIAHRRDAPAGDELAWQLERLMTLTENLIQDPVLPPATPIPALFEPGEATTLRLMRAQALEQNPSIGFVPVIESGTAYQLYVRDELPDGVASAIEALLAQ